MYRDREVPIRAGTGTAIMFIRGVPIVSHILNVPVSLPAISSDRSKGMSSERMSIESSQMGRLGVEKGA